MTRSFSILTCLGALLSITDAISLHERRGAPPRVVKFDLQRNKISDPVAHDRYRLKRRDNTISVDLENEQTLYALNLTLGSPGQDFSVNIDTGSSDLWVNTGDSSLCSRRSAPCDSAGTYNANSSSTYNYVGSWFNISYVDGSGAAGDYATDNLKIGGQTINDFQFGIGYDSSSPQNILGIGYENNEAQVAAANRKTYPNLPARLSSDGAINSRSFSLWLNDLDSNTGNLLFGGVDRAQYSGDLITVPIESQRAQSEFFITLTGVSLDGNTVKNNLGLAVLLDSGTSLTYLPDDITADIYNAVGASYDQTQGSALVPCSLANQDVNMTFSFSDPLAIEVPLSEMVLDVVSGSTAPDPFSPFDNEAQRDCLFGIAPSSGSTSVLGDTFLRSAYVVFDMDNNEVSMAQSKMNATDSKVVEIGTGANAVPSASDASGTAAATAGLPAAETQDPSADQSAASGFVPSRGGLMGAVGLTILFGLGGLLV